jgi:hypothetical protein
MTHVSIISPTSLRSASPRAQQHDELAADRQGLKPFTTPQPRQLQFGSLLDDLVSDYRGSVGSSPSPPSCPTSSP